MNEKNIMIYPDDPKKGFLIERCCIHCDEVCMMPIISFRRKSINTDGSTCYTIKARCPNCDYLNGEYKPMWWNIYGLGSMVW